MKRILCAVSMFAAFAVFHADVNVCKDVKDFIFLPVIGNCTHYYICVNDVALLRTCEDGRLFDSKTQSCVLSHQANCAPNCTDALSTFAYDHTCNKYVLCYAGKALLRECSDGLQYNAKTDRCDFPQYVDCVDNLCNIFNDPNNITYLSSKAACDKYYICMDGQAYKQTCSKGLQFNHECNCCDFQSKVQCTVAPLQRDILKSFTRTPPRRSKIRCPAEGSHFYPHDDADRYNLCVEGRGVILDCTPGLVYDKVKETCREPHKLGT